VEMSFNFTELHFPSCKDENKPNFKKMSRTANQNV
jgi:hypothetical protein